MSDTVKINKVKYKIKQHSFKAMLMFEDITGKKIGEDTDTIRDNVTFIYCTLAASNENVPFSLDEFIDIIDEEPNIYAEALQVMQKKK